MVPHKEVVITRGRQGQYLEAILELRNQMEIEGPLGQVNKMTMVAKELIDYFKQRWANDLRMLFIESLLIVWLCANLGMLVYYNLYTYQIYFHSDSAAKCMLAEEIYRTGQFFPREWVYANNDLFVIFGHLFIVPLLPWFRNGYNLHAISGIVSAAIICVSFFWLARALKMRTVSTLIGLIFFSSGISAYFSENIYGQVSYGAIVYILFSLIAAIISIGNAVEQSRYKSAFFHSVILCLIVFFVFLSNPLRAIATYFAPLCAGLIFVWILADSEVLLIPKYPVVFRFGLPLLVLMFAAFGVLYYRHIISHQFVLASSERKGLFVDFNKIASQFIMALQSLLYLSDSLPSPKVPAMSLHGMNVFLRFVLLHFSLLSVLILMMSSFSNRHFPFRVSWRTVYISAFTFSLFFFTAYLFVFTSVPEVTETIMTSRYFVPSLMLCFVCMLLVLDSIRRPAVFIALSLIISPVMLSGYANYVGPFHNAEKMVLPSDKRFLTEFLKNEGLIYGYATYWNSNVISVLSGGTVKVRAVLLGSGLPQPYLHLSSLAWYRPEVYAGESFLLLTDAELNGLNTNALYAQTGTPIKVLKFDGYSVLVFDSNISSKLFAPKREIILDAQDARVMSLVGIKDKDKGLNTTGKAGYLMFGPYVKLAAGSYSAKIFGTEIDKDGSIDVFADVAEGEKIIVREKCIALQKTGVDTQICDLKFILDNDANSFEIRVQVSEKSNIAITRYEVKPIY